MSNSIGSVSVDVVPDARGFVEKLKSQIRGATVTVNAEADTTAANAQLDEMSRTRTVKVKADVSQISRASTFLDGFIGKLGLLPALAIAASGALVPLAATLGGLTAALGAPLAIAGGGAGLFAVLGGVAVAQAQKQLKAIDVIQKHLATLTKGTDAYKTSAAQLKAAQDALPKSVGAFSDALGKLKGAFTQGGSMDVLLKPITAGLGLLADLLPAIQPILKVTGGAFSDLIGELDKGAKSKGFAEFIHQFTKQLGPDLRSLGHIFGNTAKGLSGLILAFGGKRLGGGVLDGLDSLTSKFAKFGTGARHSKWFQDFVAYFHKIGPQVGSTMKSIGTALGHIVEALTPLGPPVLHIIQGIADAFSSIPIPVLTKLAGAAAGLVAFQKLGGFKVTSFLTKGIGGSRSGAGFLGGITGGGVQKVFVVNMPPGGGLGVGAGAATGAGAAAAAEGAAGGGLLARILGKLKPATELGLKGGLLESFALAGVGAQPDTGPGIGTQFRGPVLNQKDFTAYANGLDGAKAHIKSVGTAADGVRAHLSQVAQQSELTGHSISRSFAGADAAVATFQKHLAAIHDKNVQIKVQEAAALAALQRIQNYQIANKSFSITAHYNATERNPGSGGGIGQFGAGGGTPSNPPHHKHPKTAPDSRPVIIQLTPDGQRNLDGFMQEHHDANQKWERANSR